MVRSSPTTLILRLLPRRLESRGIWGALRIIFSFGGLQDVAHQVSTSTLFNNVWQSRFSRRRWTPCRNPSHSHSVPLLTEERHSARLQLMASAKCSAKAAEESFRSNLEHGPKIKLDHRLVYYNHMVSFISSLHVLSAFSIFPLSLFFVQDWPPLPQNRTITDYKR